MSGGGLDEEIRDLEKQIEALTASKPAHDFTGTHKMQLLELEDELDQKRKARREMDDGQAWLSVDRSPAGLLTPVSLTWRK